MDNTLKNYIDNKSTNDAQSLLTKNIIVSIVVIFNLMISALLVTLWVAWLYLESTFLPALVFFVIPGLYLYCYKFKTQYFYVLSCIFAIMSLVAALALFVFNSGFTLSVIALQLVLLFCALLPLVEIYNGRLKEHVDRVFKNG